MFDSNIKKVIFRGILDQKYSGQQLKRIALFSENLNKIIPWDGEGSIIEKEKIRLQYVIDSVHALNKKIRFWNAPDDINSWKTFINMGIDYINTDQIIKLSEFLNYRGKQEFSTPGKYDEYDPAYTSLESGKTNRQIQTDKIYNPIISITVTVLIHNNSNKNSGNLFLNF